MGLGVLLEVKGLADRVTGRKSSGNTSTKLDGKTPTVLLRRNLPVHHEPSPAFRHSIRSPSMNPRSRFDSPPQEYTALHQHGNRVGSGGADPIVPIFAVGI